VLADRCVQGEQTAAAELFRREQRRVHATLFRVIGHTRDSEDLLQETFVQVFRSLPRYRAEASLSTWIDRIAVRVAYRYLRSRRPAVPLESVPDSEAPASSPRRLAIARHGVRRFYAALSQLPAASRLAFTLFEIDGRPVAEVARLTGASITATKVRLWRARRALDGLAARDPVLAEFVAGASEDLS
jgi:RNA polymerase sigma-70 factor, ECF subfamily